MEIYLARFPEGSDVRQVSRQGGIDPQWRADGRELYYKQGDALMAVPVNADMSFGEPVALFTADFDDYAPLDNGQTFLIEERVERSMWAIRVVLNWYEGYRGGAAE
jgi:hypothetical protein